MKEISKNICISNYYSRKGITHIELHIYHYIDKYGNTKELHFLFLGFSANVMMGGSRIRALDLNQYTPSQIEAKIRKRICEVTELRIFGIHKISIDEWHLDRVDLAYDLKLSVPCLTIFMLNQSFPFGFCGGMKPFRGTGLQPLESCYYGNKSRTFNLYDKLAELKNCPFGISDEEIEQVQGTVRAEVQLTQKALTNFMRSSQSRNKRNLMDF